MKCCCQPPSLYMKRKTNDRARSGIADGIVGPYMDAFPFSSFFFSFYCRRPSFSSFLPSHGRPTTTNPSSKPLRSTCGQTSVSDWSSTNWRFQTNKKRRGKERKGNPMHAIPSDRLQEKKLLDRQMMGLLSIRFFHFGKDVHVQYLQMPTGHQPTGSFAWCSVRFMILDPCLLPPLSLLVCLHTNLQIRTDGRTDKHTLTHSRMPAHSFQTSRYVC
mmetsp:Transcript_38621/g.75856  ORF Transcript_38621/g.75856 Transcript_38621/m.75856 type:complete len:216 (+) Transcript_38621:1433-2080(+)